MTFAKLVSILEDAGLAPRSYSGRAMYGQQCVGATFEGSLLGTIADITEACDDTAEASDLINSARTDNMGRGTIIYWHDVEWPTGRDR